MIWLVYPGRCCYRWCPASSYTWPALLLCALNTSSPVWRAQHGLSEEEKRNRNITIWEAFTSFHLTILIQCWLHFFFLGFTKPRRWTFSNQYHQIFQAWNQQQFYPSCDQFLISEKMQNPHSMLEPSCMCRKPITAIANAVDTLMSQSHHTISARETWVT